jgi:hypothetical protein
MECPNCKAEVTGKFCRWCGSAVSLPANNADPASVCPTCGASVRPGTKFCSKCATPLASPAEPAVRSSSECLYCGAQLKPGVRFCNSCGKPVAPAGSGGDAIPARTNVQDATVVENAPVSSPASSAAPPDSSPASWQTPPFSATNPQAETQIQTGIEPAASAYETHPASESDAQFEQHGFNPALPTTNSGFWANNKAILLTGVAVLGLAAGGLAYWFFLRRPAMNSAPSGSSFSRPATAAPNKPSALATAAPNNPAAEPQAAAQSKDATGTEPNKDPNGVSIDVTTAVPAKPGDAPASVAGPSLSGKWHGEYTNHDANEVIKVTLQMTEDNNPDRLTGTLWFDAAGSNSASCPITGVYNPHNKFMLLNIGNCRGNPPAYFFEGKIGFSSVELAARQVFGVDPAHNSLLNISRQ